MPTLRTLSLTTALCTGLGTIAPAATIDYRAILSDLNGFGASGKVNLRLDDVANTLSVRVRASGLDPDVPHVQHIHGVKNADGSNGNSVTPTAAQDSDGDGFIELLEGAATYGPIILSLTDDTVPGLGGFPTAPNGRIDSSYTYDLLTTPAYSGSFDINDLLDLADREIVIHGAFTNFQLEDNIGNGLGGGIVDDGNGNPIAAPRNYNAGLPVLAGEISVVPLPAAGWLLIAGLGGLGALRRFRKA
ncbi:CHRD domain-containing protein [Roseovarius sp. CAU 1744]|uniref:CHRD domain-containing protein n=1 Tax=Roseovarius sp. CAU 1744 TaxID=3140368 RepID=UPI00325ADC66